MDQRSWLASIRGRSLGRCFFEHRGGVQGDLEQLAVGLLVGREVGAGGGLGEELVEVAGDVVLGVAEGGDEGPGLAAGPFLAVGGQGDAGPARLAGQHVVREDLLDVPGVVPVRHLVAERLVHPAQELGLGEAEGGVAACLGEVDLRGVDADDRGEPVPQVVGRAVARHRDHVDPVRRQVL
jgi:hypothetical protein